MSESQKAEIQVARKSAKKANLLQKAVRTGLAIAVVGTLTVSDGSPASLQSQLETPTTKSSTLADPKKDISISTPASDQVSSQVQVKEPESERQSVQKDIATEFIERMELEYGVKVKVDLVLYDDVSDYVRDNFIIGPKPKDSLTKEEASVLEDAIRTIPFCSKITDKFYIVKQPMRKKGLDKYDIVSGRSKPKGRKDQGFSNVQLSLSENIDLSAPPGKYTKLGLETYEERIQQVFFHECGHRVSDKILQAAYSEDEYFDIIHDSRREKDYLKEKKHPLFISFAKLEGWKLKESEFLKEIPGDHVWVRDLPDDRMVYDKTNFYIEEHFAELFSLYFANPSLLTEQERKFFEKIDNGFRNNVDVSARQIARDPMVLLRD